jgi:hypothetical protein
MTRGEQAWTGAPTPILSAECSKLFLNLEILTPRANSFVFGLKHNNNNNGSQNGVKSFLHPFDPAQKGMQPASQSEREAQ